MTMFEKFFTEDDPAHDDEPEDYQGDDSERADEVDGYAAEVDDYADEGTITSSEVANLNNEFPSQPANDNRKLLSHHLEELHQSGWTDETARICGVYSTEDPAEIAALLRWEDEKALERAMALGPCLVIP